MHFVWKQCKMIQFVPRRLLYRWMCEQFWKCGFSIEQCLLAFEKKTVTQVNGDI